MMCLALESTIQSNTKVLDKVIFKEVPQITFWSWQKLLILVLGKLILSLMKDYKKIIKVSYC